MASVSARTAGHTVATCRRGGRPTVVDDEQVLTDGQGLPGFAVPAVRLYE